LNVSVGGTLLDGGDGWVRFLWDLANKPRESYGLVARNFLLDEGILPARMGSYRERGCLATHANAKDWMKSHEGYLLERIFRPTDGTGLPRALDVQDEDACPETFRLFDLDSDFPKADRRLHLLRVEELDFIAQRSGISAVELKQMAEEVLGSPGSAAAQKLNDVLSEWSRNVQVRPSFAAFLDDVIELFGDSPAEDPPNWADDLRDCLGLAHLDPSMRKTPLEVMVFRYPISEVPSLRGYRGVRPVVPPTVLDARPSDAFLPAPKGAKTGHVIQLSGDSRLRREVLHPVLAYEAKHLFRVGTLSRPVDWESLPEARGLHLHLVREFSGRPDYALETDGDLR
jgi:hypothetical protein